MIARLSFALALVLALILQSGALPSLEGDELYLRCKEPNGEKWGYCTGFADGVAHFLNASTKFVYLGQPNLGCVLINGAGPPDVVFQQIAACRPRTLETFPYADAPPNEIARLTMLFHVSPARAMCSSICATSAVASIADTSTLRTADAGPCVPYKRR